MRQIKDKLASETIKPLFQQLRVGLEKEGQRVTSEGQLSKTDHPKKLASRDIHPYIQTDFSETQLELITSVFDSSGDVLRFLGALHDVTLRSLDNNERIWPLSMPPVLPENEHDIVIAKLSDASDVFYRRYLAKKYGKRKQMISGIHYNFEFSDAFLKELHATQETNKSFVDFRTDIYLKTSRHYLRYRWLITYLFGASPFADKGFFNQENLKHPVRSIRNSHSGYSNQSDVTIPYDTIEAYVNAITHLIDTGHLIAAKEFYSSVRLRGADEVEELLTKGVSYIELRNIDLDPFAEYGIKIETLEFIHLFIMMMLWLDETGDSGEILLENGMNINECVSLEDPFSRTEAYEEGIWLLEQMEEMLQSLDMLDKLPLVEQARKALNLPEITLAAQIVIEQQKSHQSLGIDLAADYHARAHLKPYQLAGYRQMELSTQILLFDCLQKGVKVDLLDETDQFLKLTYQKKVEYVKNANMTSKDAYIVPLIMENKTVTKKILAKANFRVPQGMEFSDYTEAEKNYGLFSEKGFVVKPKSTNYGLGISIFREGASFEDYQSALTIAFKEDRSILVEEFLPGTEYRFFVLGGKTRAVMLRVPANVLGDGVSTITELVENKNQDNLRGSHHRAPLELIQLGDVEKLMLKEQDLSFESVPNKGEIVYLRENSNVSTGGDSIDITDEMDESYKKIAEDATKVLGAHICGIDLIIPDKNTPSTQHDNLYGIIEANFNPAMHMHIYPFSGKSRRLTMDVLKLLYKEIE